MRQIRKESLRNLAQYKDLTDEEFDLYYEEVLLRSINQDKELGEKVDDKIAELSKDYDLDDLKYNDRMQLNDLATAMVTLEDLQKVLYKENTEGISGDNIAYVERLNKVISSIRGDISKIQDDLKLSRKIRKSEKEEDVLTYLEKIKDQAKRKYEEVMTYIFCPKCKMLICNAWFLFPFVDNTITLICGRRLDSGKTCGHVFTITSKELMENKGYSEKGIFPNE